MKALRRPESGKDGGPVGDVDDGRVRTVVSLTTSASSSSLRLLVGWAASAVYPLSDFEIIDGALPSSWTARVEGEGRLTLEPSAWDIPDFWTRYFEHDPLAVALYVAELPFLDSDRPRVAHDLMTWLFADAPATEHLSWQRLFEALDHAGPSDPASATALLTLTESTGTTFPLRLLDAELLHARLFLWLTDHGARDLTTTQHRLLHRIRRESGPSLRVALITEDGAPQATAVFLEETEPQILGACGLPVAK